MKIKENPIHELFRDLTALGSMLFTTLGVVILFVLGQIQLVKQLVIGLAGVYIVGIGIRHVYFKERPQQLAHSNWVEKIYASSFPSIHSMRIWLFVVVFSTLFQNGWVTVVLISVGTLVAYSRLYLKKHDLIDIAVGTIIGAGIGFLVHYL
jgi:membrane-associated phospholipid phosphatase